MNNIAPYAAHLHLRIDSSCSVLVKYSNFTYANRITEGDPMELVPQVYPDMGTLMLHITDNRAAPIHVEIVINEVQITENVGGGLFVSLLPQLSQSNIQLKLKEIEVLHNFLVQKDFTAFHYVLRLEELMTNAGDVNTSLESVEISNNIVFQDDSTWNNEPFGIELSIGALSIANTKVHLQQTRLFNNSLPAVYNLNIDLHFHGVNIFKNNTGIQCGGALVLRMNSYIYLHRGTQLGLYFRKHSTQVWRRNMCWCWFRS